MTGTSAYILLNNDFMKSIADITLANINDQTFCRDSSTLIYGVFKSGLFTFNYHSMFSGITNFKLIYELLTTHSSNDIICSNMLYVLGRIIFSTKVLEIPESELKSFFKSGVFETIRSIMERTKSGNVVNGFLKMLVGMKKEGKIHSLIILFCHVLYLPL